jgi:hypothetical protein
MAAATQITAPPGVWTQHDPTGPKAVRIQNLSTSVPVRIAVQVAEPIDADGYAVMGPDALTDMYAEEYNVGAGESVWLRPHDHSGLSATVSLMPVSDVP